ncbi:28S ribosomal protein S29, mitochondrial isoform X2 [Micropterus dolomieu]|uniref:28S ribosomal protein S29, mitochondrial isoform X2 n=1 Tax=Micropterus dolomieu TaxID=147949 RepID=UPI001E8CD29E|nr:28S ribosomal protein S29, mitochondrial isoform X2 [Micropterus dolomieu]
MALHRLSFRLRQTVTHVRSLHTSGCGQQQEAVAVEPEPEPFSVFRTQENDPARHSEKHIGQYYTMPSAHIRTVFPHGLPWRYQQQVKTFNEACVMVRQPALEVISCLKKTDTSKPAVRYLFYGLKGSGKTMSLCHTIQFCYMQGWLVLHIPDAHLWVKNCKELLPSSYNTSRFDQPLQATEWLRNFRITNEHFLSKIKTKQRYVWTKREFTEEGSPLGELVDQVDPEELTLVYNLRKLMKNDWTGGAIITTLSQTGSLYTSKSAYLPQELLGERGFDCMDPFVPVSVPNYSEKEFESCYLYYMDRHWLQHPQCQTEEGKKELIFLSNRNPSMLDRICAFL